MTRDETVALFLQGREAWNAWAERMLAERKAMEADGRWAAETAAAGYLASKNAETRSWINAAQADFSRCLFGPHSPLQNRETTGEEKGRDGGAEPPVKSMLIDVGKIDFRSFIFPGNADFLGATFTDRADFGSAAFRRNANFLSASFTGTADFGSAAFTSYADFQSATFTRDAYFGGAIFRGTARFRSAVFLGDASFENATFRANAIFDNTAFGHYTTFASARFLKEASLIGLKVERPLNLKGAGFVQVPAFNQADFKQAPHLDDVSFPIPGFFRGGKAELVAQYRAIRRMAIQGADYEREQMAFKGEIRAKRWTENRWYHAGRWFGIFYDAFSDFGRSTWRPPIAWLACIAIFAVYFLGQNEAMTTARALQPEPWSSTPIAYLTTAWDALWYPPYCYPGTKPLPLDPDESPKDRFTGLVEKVRDTTNLVNEALSIAYHNAVIILDSSGNSAHRSFGCLYGVERYGGNPVAFVPRSVAIASGIQKLLSAIFIFLFILAVRNMLRVK
jgi:Pentapeptide repeats (9 copies)